MEIEFDLDDETDSALNRAVEISGRSHEEIIQEAIQEWLERHGKRGLPT